MHRHRVQVSWRVLRAQLLLCMIQIARAAACTRGYVSERGPLDRLCPGAPTVHSVHPKLGTTEGGTSLTITGSGFCPRYRLENFYVSLCMCNELSV
mmetsp:Transcript_10123/g.46326  ORF Transcript_10123/g.46326 Transcript_10123/m.46326 type:complete len:96 (+) Transcript_10123:154-441(+)